LDPYQRHVSYSFSTVSDLAALWNQVAKANLGAARAPTTLYPLSASKMKIEKDSTDQTAQDEMEMLERTYYMRRQRISPTPAAAVTQNGFVSAGAGLISNSMTGIE